MSRATPPDPAHAHDGHVHEGHAHEGHAHEGHAHEGHAHEGHAHAHGARSDHGHTHGHGHVRAKGRRALAWALAITVGFCIFEAVMGIRTGSLALFSDAAHMLTDALGLLVAFVAAVLRDRPRSARNTFGLARLPVLGGLVNGVLVLVTAAYIVVEAVARLQNPLAVPGLPVLITASVGLVVNLVGALWLHQSGDRGVNLRGAELHMLGDALGSVAAIVSGIVLMVSDLRIIDPIASLVVAGVIAVGAVRLLADVSSILLERAPKGVDKASVQKIVDDMPLVRAVVSLHAWELDSGEAVASLVLSTAEPSLVALAAAADTLRTALRSELNVAHATIEWRPLENPRPCCDDAPEHGHAHPA